MLTRHFTFTRMSIASPWFSVRPYAVSATVRGYWVVALSASVLRSSTAFFATWTVLAPIGPVRVCYHYGKKIWYKENANIRSICSFRLFWLICGKNLIIQLILALFVTYQGLKGHCHGILASFYDAEICSCIKPKNNDAVLLSRTLLVLHRNHLLPPST